MTCDVIRDITWKMTWDNRMTLKELEQALKEDFNFTSFDTLPYKGKRKQPLIDKLNEMEEAGLRQVNRTPEIEEMKEFLRKGTSNSTKEDWDKLPSTIIRLHAKSQDFHLRHLREVK